MKTILKRFETEINIVIVFCFLVTGIFLHAYLNRCTECGKLNVKEAHRQMCERGHVFYNCQPDQVSRHTH